MSVAPIPETPPVRVSRPWWKRHRRVIAFLGFVFAIGLTIQVFRGLPDVASAAMKSSASFEIFSLDPKRLDKNDSDSSSSLHGFKILGRSTLDSESERMRLISALQFGAKWNLGLASLCFVPRHGIRVIDADGEPIDLVICFECNLARVYRAGGSESFVIGKSPEKTFDAMLTAGGVPLAPKSP
jgi:hypothetical protein